MDQEKTDRDFEIGISKALLKGTEKVVNHKETVWLAIQKNLEATRSPQKRRGAIKWLSVAAALTLVFLVGTEPGQAAFKKVKEIFLPEKTIVEELEGHKEKSKVSLHESQKANYVIYFDKERYYMEKSGETERIVPLAKPIGDYPEVFMEISQIKNTTPEVQAEVIEQQLKDEFTGEFSRVENKGPVVEPLEGIYLSALSGLKNNSTLVKYYLVDNKVGGTIIIKQQYFLEAEEGHGVRFDNMLKEFKVLEKSSTRE